MSNIQIKLSHTKSHIITTPAQAESKNEKEKKNEKRKKKKRCIKEKERKKKKENKKQEKNEKFLSIFRLRRGAYYYNF